jgi:membrane protein YqaA with SNARE-associated domain
VGGVDALLITMAVKAPRVAYLAALWAILGSVAGSLILFAIARKGGEVLLQKHISSQRGKRLHAWFERYGLITVFIPAISPIPLPMKVPVFCAGALEVRWSYFAVVVAAARAIRYFALAYLGLHYGRATFHFLAAHAVEVGAIAVTASVLAIVALQIVTRRQAARSKSAIMSK